MNTLIAVLRISLFFLNILATDSLWYLLVYILVFFIFWIYEQEYAYQNVLETQFILLKENAFKAAKHKRLFLRTNMFTKRTDRFPTQ